MAVISPAAVEAIRKRDEQIVAMRRAGKLSLKKIGAALHPPLSGAWVARILERVEPGLVPSTAPSTAFYTPGKVLENGTEVLERLPGGLRCKYRCHCSAEFEGERSTTAQCRGCSAKGRRRVPLEKIMRARASGMTYAAIMKKFKYRSIESVRRALRQGEREAAAGVVKS